MSAITRENARLYALRPCPSSRHREPSPLERLRQRAVAAVQRVDESHGFGAARGFASGLRDYGDTCFILRITVTLGWITVTLASFPGITRDYGITVTLASFPNKLWDYGDTCFISDYGDTCFISQ